MTPLVVDASVWVSAADPREPLSELSGRFISRVEELRHPIALPAHAEVEIACALSRRLGDAERGRLMALRVRGSPLITTHRLSDRIVRRAISVGTRKFLRSGDALYAALAEMVGGKVVSWDRELVQRAGATTPEAWLAGRLR